MAAWGCVGCRGLQGVAWGCIVLYVVVWGSVGDCRGLLGVVWGCVGCRGLYGTV